MAGKLTRWEQDLARQGRGEEVDATQARWVAPAAEPDSEPPHRPAVRAPKSKWVQYLDALGVQVPAGATKPDLIAIADSI